MNGWREFSIRPLADGDVQVSPYVEWAEATGFAYYGPSDWLPLLIELRDSPSCEASAPAFGQFVLGRQALAEGARLGAAGAGTGLLHHAAPAARTGFALHRRAGPPRVPRCDAQRPRTGAEHPAGRTGCADGLSRSAPDQRRRRRGRRNAPSRCSRHSPVASQPCGAGRHHRRRHSLRARPPCRRRWLHASVRARPALAAGAVVLRPRAEQSAIHRGHRRACGQQPPCRHRRRGPGLSPHGGAGPGAARPQAAAGAGLARRCGGRLGLWLRAAAAGRPAARDRWCSCRRPRWRTRPAPLWDRRCWRRCGTSPAAPTTSASACPWW